MSKKKDDDEKKRLFGLHPIVILSVVHMYFSYPCIMALNLDASIIFT